MRALRFFALASLAFWGQLTLAHTELAGSIPSPDSTIETGPEEVMLHFSAPVRLTALTIQQEGEDEWRLGPLSTEPSEHFTVASPDLSEGSYTVSWRALSDDSHTMTGEFSFVIGEAGEHDSGESHGEHSAAD